MGLFSKELRELDRNTVQLMIDEMQEELEQKEAEIEKQKEEAQQQKNAAKAEKMRADRLQESEHQKSEQLEAALRRIAELEKQRA